VLRRAASQVSSSVRHHDMDRLGNMVASSLRSGRPLFCRSQDLHVPVSVGALTMHHSNTFSTTASPSSSDRKSPFRVLGLQQVAIGHENKKNLRKLWVDILGLRTVSSFQSSKENVDEDICQLGPTTKDGAYAVEIDLMQPLDAEKSPKVHVPPLNHIGLWIDDLKVAVDHLTQQGVRFAPGGIRAGASGHKVAFIHPKFPLSGEGVLIELVQAPPHVIKALSEK